MWMILVATAAFGGEVILDAKVPVELYSEGQPLVTVFRTGIVHLDLPAGPTIFTVMVNGRPQTVDVTVPEVGAVSILVGKTGISTAALAPPETPAATGPAKVSFRIVGSAGVLLLIDGKRYPMAVGDEVVLDLEPGKHTFQSRDSKGQTVWARGQVAVVGPGELVVQISEGRYPEVSGVGGSFIPDGS